MNTETNISLTPKIRSKTGIALVLMMLTIGSGSYLWGCGSKPNVTQTTAEAGHADKEAGGEKHTDEHKAEEKGQEEHSDEAGGENHVESSVVKFDEDALKLAKLGIEAVSETALQSRLAVTGAVEANPTGTVTITPRVDGKITKLFVTVGDQVKPGQTLAIVESEKLHEAQVAHRLATKRLALARDVLQRRKKLAALGEYGRPGVEQARVRLTETEGQTRAAQNEINAAQAGVSQSEGRIRAAQSGLKQAEAQQTVIQARVTRAQSLFREELLSRQDLEVAQADLQRAGIEIETARATVAQAESEKEAADVRLHAARAALDTARKQQTVASKALERAELVYRGGFNTSKEVAEAESAYQQAQIEVEGALDDVQLLGGRPGNLHEIPVKAPIAGRVTERVVTLGQTLAAGERMMTLLNTETVWVQLNVFSKDLAAVRVGQTVALTAESVPGVTFSGTVSYIGETLDESTRTARVRCTVRYARGRLKPGAFVAGSIVTNAQGQQRGIVVPQDAVQELEGKQVVFVAEEHEGEFKTQSVEVGNPVGNRVEIRSGLKAGDRIVTRNAFTVKAQAMKAELGDND
jgi:RND family efflux transporter MFP subunit